MNDPRKSDLILPPQHGPKTTPSSRYYMGVGSHARRASQGKTAVKRLASKRERQANKPGMDMD